MKFKDAQENNWKFSFKVTSLIADQPSSSKKGRSKRAHLLVENVIRATENFINKANEIANENPDMRNDLLQSMKEVQRSGKNINKIYFYLSNSFFSVIN